MSRYFDRFDCDDGGHFTNFFAELDNEDVAATTSYKEPKESAFGSRPDGLPKDSFTHVGVWDHKAKGSCLYNSDDGRVYAQKVFTKGDRIEIDPIMILDERDLYSPNVRQVAFEISRAHGKYGMVIGGYVACCRTSGGSGKEGNIDYRWDPRSPKIIEVYAIKTIKPGSELVLLADEAKFVNAIHPHDITDDETGVALRDAKIVAAASSRHQKPE